MDNSDNPTGSDKMYSMPLEYVYEMIAQNEQHVSVAKDLISDFIKDKKISDKVLFILVEILFVSMSVLRLLDEEIETSVFHKNEASGKKEFIITSASIRILQSLVLSKHHAIINLNKLSYSVSLH